MASRKRGRRAPAIRIIERRVGPLLSSKRILAMWYFDSGLAELMGVVYRLCTVIWGN
jgi:hypothetical protein